MNTLIITGVAPHDVQRWQATLNFLIEDCGLDASGTETLIRLAATVADESHDDSRNPYVQALRSFSEPTEVHALATGVAKRLYSA